MQAHSLPEHMGMNTQSLHTSLHHPQLRVTSGNVHLQKLELKGMGEEGEDKGLVEVVSGSCTLEQCQIEGGAMGHFGGAVRVVGDASSLCVHMCNIHSDSSGVVVQGGGRAVLQQSTVCECRASVGVLVAGRGSTLHAQRCRVDRSMNNIRVEGGGACSGSPAEEPLAVAQ